MAGEPDRPTASRGNVLLLGSVSFINDTSSKIILPVLPLFITQLGGGGLAVGLISGVGDFAASLFKFFAGYWSDRTGKRKVFVFSGYLLSAFAKLLFAFTTQWPQVLALRVAERLGKGIRSAPRDALLAAATARHTRGRSFGIHRAMDSGGAVLGTLIAFALLRFAGLSYAQIFLVAGLIGFASLLPIAFVREQVHPPHRPGHRFGLRKLPAVLRSFILVAFLFALANFSYMFFVLRSESAFAAGSGAGIPILLYGLYNLAYTLFAVPAGIASDRVGRRKVLMSGYGLFALVSVGFIFASSLPTFVLLFVLYGLSYALVEANERAYVSDLAPESERGSALGSYHMATSIASLPAGLMAGLLWDLAPVFTFAAGAALAALAVTLLATSRHA
jgi:MFS family permease